MMVVVMKMVAEFCLVESTYNFIGIYKHAGKDNCSCFTLYMFYKVTYLPFFPIINVLFSCSELGLLTAFPGNVILGGNLGHEEGKRS